MTETLMYYAIQYVGKNKRYVFFISNIIIKKRNMYLTLFNNIKLYFSG